MAIMEHARNTRSIVQQYQSAPVLITGAVGFLGSVVLEQLLRATQVPKVYLLLRAKRTTTPQQRAEQLLCSGLFHEARNLPGGMEGLLQRVHVVEGDLSAPGLGLNESDAALLKQEVQVVLHCGASVVLDADIQRTISNNYMGTRKLLALSAEMVQLRAFVHVSTYFVNNHLPRNSLVKEALYPLDLEGLTHAQLVEQLMGASPEQANALAAQHMDRLSFTSTYAFGKHLTELMVADTLLPGGAKRAIVRPGLIANTAAGPYPGFISNFAGPSGWTLSCGIGMFMAPGAVGYAGDMILDIIPVDVVSSLIIGAGAAAAADAAAAASGLPVAPKAKAVAPARQSEIEDAEVVVEDGVPVTAEISFGADPRKDLMIYHASSSASHPLTLPHAFRIVKAYFKNNPAPLRLPLARWFTIDPNYKPKAQQLTMYNKLVGTQIKLIRAALTAAGDSRAAAALKNGFKSWKSQNSARYDRSLRSCVDNARALQQQLPADEAQLFRTVWEPQDMSWELYCTTGCAGLSYLLLRQKSTPVKVQHSFNHIPDMPAPQRLEA